MLGRAVDSKEGAGGAPGQRSYFEMPGANAVESMAVRKGAHRLSEQFSFSVFTSYAASFPILPSGKRQRVVRVRGRGQVGGTSGCIGDEDAR
jgi:hypothetical protein